MRDCTCKHSADYHDDGGCNMPYCQCRKYVPKPSPRRKSNRPATPDDEMTEQDLKAALQLASEPAYRLLESGAETIKRLVQQVHIERERRGEREEGKPC